MKQNKAGGSMVYEYHFPGATMAGRCEIEMRSNQANRLLVLRDLVEITPHSVTNRIEWLVPNICREFDLDPWNLTVLCHSPRRSSASYEQHDWHVVEFDVSSDPWLFQNTNWHRVEIADVRNLFAIFPNSDIT
jgi:hypothetical protein